MTQHDTTRTFTDILVLPFINRSIRGELAHCRDLRDLLIKVSSTTTTEKMRTMVYVYTQVVRVIDIRRELFEVLSKLQKMTSFFVVSILHIHNLEFKD